MNTIEPRLIALLYSDVFLEPYGAASRSLTTTSSTNANSYLTSPSLDLPPLQDPNILKASGRPLVLEPDASNGNPQHANLVSCTEDSGHRHKRTKKPPTERALGNSSPQSLRKILDDGTGITPSLISKKRGIDTSKDDFVQLPQPPKKQKAARGVVPPIIIGLFEPPPQAALFPPIASSSFHDSHGRNTLNTVPAEPHELQEKSSIDDFINIDFGRKDSGEEESRGTKERRDVEEKVAKEKKDGKAARKKWSEDETNNLLLGVAKYGVGKWLQIVEDPEFWFNGRTAPDLKDRFRTCCPAELGGKASKRKKPQKRVQTSGKSISSLLSANILIDEDEVATKEVGREKAQNKEHRPRAHRKNLEDLVRLGIGAPWQQSQRRTRKAFSEQDDREILLGYQEFGPAWSRIKNDPRFHLQDRQPTDLRDRFRNKKYPEKFRTEEANTTESRRVDEPPPATVAPTSTPASTLQSSSSREGLRIHQIISENYDPIPQVRPSHSQSSSFNFKESFSYSDAPVEVSDGLPSFDWTNNAPFPSNIGDMDISRLLLDEPWMEPKERPSFTDINSILSNNTDGYNHVTSYYDMLNNDSINLSASVPLDADASCP